MTHILFIPLYFAYYFGLVGCGDSSAEASAGSDYSYNNQLRQFDVVDSYSTNSEFDAISDLAISPYRNSGTFEIFEICVPVSMTLLTLESVWHLFTL
jgi:hypothetical protein